VVARRRQERAALLDLARRFVDDLDQALAVRAVVVVGSVARGDHYRGSDVDVLVVAERLPEDPIERLRAVGWPAPRPVEPVVWTLDEWRGRLAKGDLIATEAIQAGVWLRGAAGSL